jgi:hypothetical protein
VGLFSPCASITPSQVLTMRCSERASSSPVSECVAGRPFAELGVVRLHRFQQCSL